MTDRAMSEATMLANLRDIHLPEVAAGGPLAEIAVVVGLALLAAVAVAGCLRLLSVRARPARRTSPTEVLSALNGLSPADRRIAVLHLLRDHAPDRYAAVKGQLYRPGAVLDIAGLEEEVAQRV